MRILVLGGDAYLGWSTATYPSAPGHRSGVLDDTVRRQHEVVDRHRDRVDRARPGPGVQRRGSARTRTT